MGRHGRVALVMTVVGFVVAIMVAPVGAYTPASEPDGFVADDDQVFFQADDGIHGIELWTTDGTAPGTGRLTDIAVGFADGYPTDLTPLGDLLLFVARDDAHGAELWSIDRTTDAVSLVRDIWPGPENGSPDQLTVVGDEVYFTAWTDADGQEIWRTDGTTAGTERVTSLAPGDAFSRPSRLTALGTWLVFSDWISSDRELGLFDTTTDTYTRQDINPGGSGSPSGFLAFGGHLYFSADDGSTGTELWRTDGTPAGTSLVQDIWAGATGSYPQPLGILDGRLLLSAYDPAVGGELFTTDGSTVTLVKDIHPGGDSRPSRLTVAGDRAFFGATTAGEGYELWTTDGTGPGTTLARDINPGPDSSNASDFVGLPDGRILLEADDGDGSELWTSDGTPATTTKLVDLSPDGVDTDVHDTIPFHGGALLSLDRNRRDGGELWFTDGTSAGTQRIRKLNPGVLTPDHDEELLVVAGNAYFSAWDDTHGAEPWVSDGTPAGTHRIADVQTGPLGSEPEFLGSVNGKILFRAWTSAAGVELWATDGTPAGTTMLADIYAGAGDASPSSGADVGGIWVFAAEDETDGIELFATDGTAGGTAMVLDINPAGDSRPQGLLAFDGHAVFEADDGTNGAEPWITDGTAGGTTMVADINPTGDSSPGGFTRLGTEILFAASDGSIGRELWKTDGTTAGTVLVKDVWNDASHSSNPSRFAVAGSTAFFRATDANGSELWASDGTGAGTTMVADLAPGAGNGSPDHIAAVGGAVLFDAYAPATGRELYRAVGGSAELVADLSSGTDSTTFYGAAPAFDRYVFSAATPSEGQELFVSDGTTAGTGLLASLAPGAASSSPDHLRSGSLWFSAWSSLTDRREVFHLESIDGDAIRVTPPSPFVDRLAGPTREGTAVAVSQASYPFGATTVLLARSDTYPDSLAGAPLARYLNAPILLTPSTSLHPDVQAEIDRLGATRLVVLGGTAAVSQAVVDAVVAQTGVVAVDRIAGADRFETAAEIAGRVPSDGHAYVAEGANPDPRRGWPDALSVSSLAAAQQRPILLVTRDAVPAATAGALTGLAAVTVVGGEAAVGPGVYAQIDAAVPTVDRIFGPDRYATSTAVAAAATAAGANDRIVYLATGENFPDALVAGPEVATSNGVLLLVHPQDIAASPGTRDWITSRAGTLEAIRILGGENAVSAAVEAVAAQAVSGG